MNDNEYLDIPVHFFRHHRLEHVIARIMFADALTRRIIERARSR